MAQNPCKKQYAVRLHFFLTSLFFIHSSTNGAKPLQKTAHRATTLFSRAIQPLYSSQSQLQNRCKTIAKNNISRASTCVPRPLLLFRFLLPHATLSTSPNASPTRPKTGAACLKTGPRRPKTCPTWPKTALRQACDGSRQAQGGPTHAQRGSSQAQDGSRQAQDGSRQARDGLKQFQGASTQAYRVRLRGFKAEESGSL